MQADTFQGSGGFVELGKFDKHFSKKTRKKGRNIWEFFLLDTLIYTF